MIRLFLADDIPAVREVMRCCLEETLGRFRIVGEAGDGLEALAAIERVAPDVIILDVDMPGMTGLEVARTLRSRGDDTPVILCSSWEGTEPAELPGGICHQLRKPFRMEHLTAAVELVAGELVHAD